MLLSPAVDDGRRRRRGGGQGRGLYLKMEGWQECGRGTRHAARERSRAYHTKFNKEVLKFSFPVPLAGV